MLTVGIKFMTTEKKYKMKYTMYVNTKNKDSLTPLHITVEIFNL